ncbi:MAG TPA: MFS transporter [Candidatus Eremiobacteraeota bacterium]|nr:MAG: Major Facilitator Superfamily protein [bacterium ADurb.Bin363]HPZ10503.1 MFS transporter [Candidatus Eremiobacteraeota bacterium]
MRNTDRTNLFIAKLCYMVAGFSTSIIMLYLPIYIFHFNRSYLAVSMIFTLPAITSFFAQNLWGFLADITGKVKIFLLTTILSYILFFLSVFIFKNYILLLISLGIFSLFHVAMIPSVKAYTTILNPKKKGQALGELSSFDSFGWAIGATLSILLFFHKNDINQIYLLFQILLYISAGLFFIIIFFFKETSFIVKREGQENLINKLSLIYINRGIQTGALIILSISIPNIIFFSMFSIFFCDYIGAPKWLLGISMSVACFTGAIAYYIYGKIADRVNPLYLVYGAACSYLSLFLTFIFIKNPLVIAIYYSLPFYPAVNIATGKYIAEITKENERSMGLGALEGAYAFGRIFAPLIAGATVKYVGIKHLPLVSLLVLFSGFSLLYFLRLRNTLLSESVPSLDNKLFPL